MRIPSANDVPVLQADVPMRRSSNGSEKIEKRIVRREEDKLCKFYCQARKFRNLTFIPKELGLNPGRNFGIRIIYSSLRGHTAKLLPYYHCCCVNFFECYDIYDVPVSLNIFAYCSICAKWSFILLQHKEDLSYSLFKNSS